MSQNIRNEKYYFFCKMNRFIHIIVYSSVRFNAR